MLQTLPFELLENIVFYLNGQDLYSLSKVDSRVAQIFLKTCYWVVKLPKTIDWSSPDAPKKYKPYDGTDFTIHYQDKELRRSQGVAFSAHKIKGRRCIVSNHSTPIILYRDSLIVDMSIAKITPSLQLGETKLPLSYWEIIHMVCSPAGWVHPDKRGTRGCDNGERGERGPVGIKPPRTRRVEPENRWRSTQNIRIRGKRYETDFSLEFKTEPDAYDSLENDE
jgi:hypothetical protein